MKFECSECGHLLYQWVGRCSACQSWNTIMSATPKVNHYNNRKTNSKKLSEINLEKEHGWKSGIDIVDKALGGSIVCGSINLMVGEPGVGKSTILLKMLDQLLKVNPEMVAQYVSGEEPLIQLASRSRNLCVTSENILYLYSQGWEEILYEIKMLKPDFLIIDSIQTVISSDLSGRAGSLNQIREITSEVISLSKSMNITTFIIGHINKDGCAAGPKTLEHYVDTVLYVERDKKNGEKIILPKKNRFLHLSNFKS